MESIEDLAVGPCDHSQYLRPFRLRYRQNGISKKWDFMRTHDSVAILIFNTSRRCFVVVKQFRPAVYMCEMERLCPQVFERENQESWCPLPGHLPASTGVTYELCAGIVDKPELSLEETACMEVLEECGYEIPTASLKKITSCSPKPLQSYFLSEWIGRMQCWNNKSCRDTPCSLLRESTLSA
ncbi:uridine diphosphate glucose pyrophosphatase NUDT14 isoform X3 [Podarcis raffonei]|uniref:uridine diphosphate glucose pyrophosphatase NUDT14 isoform X3 n=1 Tax=Podarcis raffonei TaxID=65483 RepID=UPI0023293B94|nr:uridine diphosphate glucose pyrophosphatase NUDT14 isoform X3 [Podarcis raffonei]